MRVRLLQRYAGPDGNYAAGTEIEVSAQAGRDLCEAGYATPVKCIAGAETAAIEPPETTAIEDMPAPAPRGRRRGQLKGDSEST